MNAQRQIVLGLDGGGTKTVCVAYPSVFGEGAQDAAPPLARTVVGSTNWNSVGPEAARLHLQQAIEQTVQDAERTVNDVAAVCLGVSGVDRPEDHARMQAWLCELLPDVPSLIHNDAVIALASGTGGHLFGIVLISGTGMIAMGFNRAGERRRSGGWGALLGDGGSGYAIGAAILRAVTWAADGRGPATPLTSATLSTLGLDRAEQLVRWTYDDVSWNRIAEIAPLAMRAAEAGDPVAIDIVRGAANDLALAVESVARGLGIQNEAFPLVLAGGGLRSGVLTDRLMAHLRRTLPQASLVMPPVEPAIGAAMLASRYVESTSASS